MPDWLYSLPDDAIIALIVAVVVGAEVVIARLYRSVPRLWIPPSSAGLLLDAFRLLVTLTGLVLAFSLVQAQSNLREIHTVLEREASTLELAARELQHLAGTVAQDARARLVTYGFEIVTEEWPMLSHGQRNVGLDRQYGELMRVIDNIQPTADRQGSTYSDLLKNLDLLGYLRDQRVAAGTIRLPVVFWHAIWVLVLAAVLLAAASPATLPYRLSTLVPLTALSILIALVAIIDVPFQGQSAIRPYDLQHVLDRIGADG
jgi:hypothetical protein